MGFRSALLLVLVTCAQAAPAVAAPGGIDRSFGENGRVTTALGGKFETIRDVGVQAGSRIVAAGLSWHTPLNASSPKGRAAIVRYRSNGHLDRSFGRRGARTLSLKGKLAAFEATAVQPDGNIIAVGYGRAQKKSRGGVTQLIAARYTSRGQLDRSFGDQGFLATDLAELAPPMSSGAAASDVVVQPDGRIVVAGRSFSEGGVGFLVRLEPDGSVDRTFSGDGVVAGPASDYNSLAIDGSGRLVAAGTAPPASGQEGFDIAVARFLPDGSSDPTLDGDGFARIVLATEDVDEVAQELALATDGSTVLAGVACGSRTDPGCATFISRVAADGSLDAAFGVGGVTYLPVATRDGAAGLVLQPDGPILLAVSERLPSKKTQADFSVRRYTTEGITDTTFGTNGLTGTDFFGRPDSPGAAVLQGGGLVIAGNYQSGPPGGDAEHFALARFRLE